MNNYTIFISDLHLNFDEQTSTKLFLKFSEDIAQKADAIYILGDFFTFWIGDDDDSKFNKQIKSIIKKFSDKTQVYIMPGNRDFILGQKFAKETGCFLITDPHKIDLYGKPTLLTHGDILCTKDVIYKIFRSIIRIHTGINIFLKMPLKMRLCIARSIQKFSKKIKTLKRKNNMSPQTNTIKKLLINYNSIQIIHGHTHSIKTEEFTVNNEKMMRFSLGSWESVGNIFIYYKNGQYEFKAIT